MKKSSKRSENFKGNKNPSWKGGVYPIHEEIIGSEKYKEWRISILNRDNWTCVQCGKSQDTKNISYPNWSSKKSILNVDHIISFSKIMEKMRFEIGVLNIFENAMSYDLLWDTSNGRTLCIPCHKKTDTYKKG